MQLRWVSPRGVYGVRPYWCHAGASEPATVGLRRRHETSVMSNAAADRFHHFNDGFASGFQFVSSVIGGATLSTSMLIRNRPSLATSVLPPLLHVAAAKDDARGEEPHRGARFERGLGDRDRHRHQSPAGLR